MIGANARLPEHPASLERECEARHGRWRHISTLIPTLALCRAYYERRQADRNARLGRPPTEVASGIVVYWRLLLRSIDSDNIVLNRSGASAV
jgi:hypothetical protein